jgi:gamma-glutamyltranspeptidase
VSDTKVCSEVGAKLLKKGGSAVDAAVATSLCVGIVNPQTSGIGGGGVMVIRNQKSDSSHVIDFMGSSPESWSDKSNNLGQSVNVPGMLRGLEVAHNKFGKLSWKDVILSVKSIVDYRSGSQNSTAISADNGHAQKMSEFLEQLAEKGSKLAFYEGEVAQEVVDLVNQEGGNMVMSDLKRYEPIVAKPVSSSFFEMTVLTTAAPSDGPILLLMLNILENITMDSVMPMNSTDLFHFIVETMKLAYGQGILMNDPQNWDLMKNVTDQLVSKEFAALLASRIDPNRTHSSEYYTVDDSINLSQWSDSSAGSSHISVIGPSDDIVSVTLSLNDEKGSDIRTHTGFYLNNHLKNSKLFKPVAPVIAYKTNSPCGQRLAIGGAHGNFSAAGLAEVLLSIVSNNAEINDAVSASRLYADVANDNVLYEATIPTGVISMLAKKGHTRLIQLDSEGVKVNVASKINELVFGYTDHRSMETGDAVF